MASRPEQITRLPCLQDACERIRILLPLVKEKNGLLSRAEEVVNRSGSTIANLVQECNTMLNNGQRIPPAREQDIVELCKHLKSLQTYHEKAANYSTVEQLKGLRELATTQENLKRHLEKLSEPLPQLPQHYGQLAFQPQNHPAYAGGFQYPQSQPVPPPWGQQFQQGYQETNEHSQNTTGNQTKGSHNIRSSHSGTGINLSAHTVSGVVQGTQTNNNYGSSMNGGFTPGYGGGYAKPRSTNNANSHNTTENRTNRSHNITSTHTGNGTNLACDTLEGVVCGNQTNNQYGPGYSGGMHMG